MSRHEERTWRIVRKRPTLSDLKGQRERLRQDLEQFASRKPDAAVIASLKERLRALDAEIALAESDKKRDGDRPAGEEGDGGDAFRSSSSKPGAGGRFSPRGWRSDGGDDGE